MAVRHVNRAPAATAESSAVASLSAAHQLAAQPPKQKGCPGLVVLQEEEATASVE